MAAFLKGVLLSLSLALSIGPGLVLQFQASVRRGFMGGCMVLGGRYLSDISLLTLSYIGVLQIMTSQTNQRLSGLIGSLALVIFGASFMVKKNDQSLNASSPGTQGIGASLFSYFFSSLTINTMNPFVCVFWIGLVAVAGTMFGIHSKSILHFFGGLPRGRSGFRRFEMLPFQQNYAHC